MEDVQESAGGVDKLGDAGGPDTSRRGTDGSSIGGGTGTSDSNLDESWRMNLAGAEGDSEEGEEGEDVNAVVGNAGVLGLIHQFQKVSNENRAGGTTVGM
jgi:autophagy-related protein 9